MNLSDNLRVVLGHISYETSKIPFKLLLDKTITI